jgi:hypothetical protein
MERVEWQEGRISYLTKRRGGCVREKGIVTIASKLTASGHPIAAADLLWRSDFGSIDEPPRGPRQWVSWDSHEMRVRRTHYTMIPFSMKSWVEGSLDKANWSEIDRRTNSQDFVDGWGTASFAVSASGECRFVRLVQTDKKHNGHEFFRTLSESWSVTFHWHASALHLT